MRGYLRLGASGISDDVAVDVWGVCCESTRQENIPVNSEKQRGSLYLHDNMYHSTKLTVTIPLFVISGNKHPT